MTKPDLLRHPATELRSVDKGVLFRVYERTILPWAVRQLPASVSPNSITLVGQACAVVALAAAAAAISGRPYFYPVSAALFMAYLFADILDGMQARRTGRTSEVGELLDHGLDALSAVSAALTIGLVLRVPGSLLVALSYMVMLAFVAAYWEQYRTGLLLCPEAGQSESFTGLALLLLALQLFREPGWLLFSARSITVGTVLVAVVLLGSLAAVAGTVWRVMRQGIPAGHLLLFAVASLAPVGYLLVGADPWPVGVMMGLFAGDVVVRAIRLRRRGRLGPLVGWFHALLLLPLAGAWLPGKPLTPSVLALAATAVLAAIYASGFVRGLGEQIPSRPT